MLKGHVKDRDGEPIGGVRVTVLDHPELGETNTRADGAFDIAVNGGGDHARVRGRRLPAGAAHARAGLAGLRDARRRRDGPGRPERQDDRPGLDRAVPGRPAAPRPRTRTASARARCCSRRASTARWSSRTASAKPLDELKVRVTEFTYGDQGDEAMPGSLPANSRLHVRRRVQRRRGAEGRRDPGQLRQAADQLHRELHRRARRQRRPHRLLRPRDGRVEGREERPRHQGPLRGGRHRRRRHRRRRQGRRRHRPRHDRRGAQAARDALRARPGAVARADHPLHAVGPQLALRPAARRPAAAAEGVRVEGPQRPVPAEGLDDRLRDADAAGVRPGHRHRHDAQLLDRPHARAGRSTRRSRSRSSARRSRRA